MGSVATTVLQRLIVLAPKKAVRGNSNQDQSLLRCDAVDFAKRVQVVIGVLEHIQRCDYIETTARKWQVLHRRKGDGLNAAALAKVQGIHRSIDPDRRGQTSEGAHIRASPATDIENSSRTSSGYLL